ncbi:MAG TPA: hypothetical protein VFL04_02405, partial [Rectinemataceae bacterium]|nr:hypothetical protein [Rectinemataceae bacterium]
MRFNLREALRDFWSLINRGKNPYTLSVGLLVVAAVLVYLSPRSIPVFLLFAVAAGLPYFLEMRKPAKLAIAV